jgi:leucyl aminopeptidase
VAADALLVVLGGDTLPADLDKPLASASRPRSDAATFAQAGQALYLHGVAGVKAARVAFVAAAATGISQAWRKALAAGLGAEVRRRQARGGGDRWPARSDDAHARGPGGGGQRAGLRLPPDQAQRPGAASKLAERVSLVCAKAAAAALAPACCAVPVAAEGMTLARECANRPATTARPRTWPPQAKRLGKEHGLKVEVLERKDCEKLGMGCLPGRGAGLARAPKFIVMRWLGAPRPRRRWCWSARASPSTPAASRSSRRPRWTR